MSRFKEPYQALKEKWQRDDSSAALRHFLTTELLSHSDIVINSVVVVGLGSVTGQQAVQRLDKPASDIERSPEALHQLIALEDWLAVLRQKHTIHKVVLLDPAFQKEDRALFYERGWEIIPVLDETPVPCDLVTPTTFLFAPYPPTWLLAKLLPSANPAAVICFDTRDKDPKRKEPEYEPLYRYLDANKQRSLWNDFRDHRWNNRPWCFAGLGVYFSKDPRWQRNRE